MRPILSRILILFCSSLIIMWYAFYNGYPLATSDTGAYIGATFDFKILKDRSSFYSVFMAIAGLRWVELSFIRGSLWFPIFFQSTIVSFLTYRLYHVFAGKTPNAFIFLLITILISIGTALSWVASYAMPDIFAGILLLAVILYLFDDSESKWLKIIYLPTISLAMIIHNSHFVIMLMWGVCILIYIYLSRNKIMVHKITHLLMVTVICIVSVCSLNAIKGFGFVVSPGSHVFLIGKLAETNVLQTYLHENCETDVSALCQYKDDIPESAIEYIWADNSAFHKIGGWAGSGNEHKKLLKNIFTTPRYIYMYAKKAIEHSLIQLVNVQIPIDEQSFNEGTSPYNNLNKHLPIEITQLINAKQQQSAINNGTLRPIQLATFILSSLWVIFLLIRQPLSRPIINIYIAVILFIVCNAVITASMANILSRLQFRAFWVLPAVNIIVIFNYYTSKRLFPPTHNI